MILILGANGYVGSAFKKLLKSSNRAFKGFSIAEIDYTQLETLKEILEETKPEFLINAAGYTGKPNVDACENNKIACDALNVGLVESLVNVAAQINAHLIHLSTDFIFDGLQGNYKETDLPNPLNYYGISKLKSEEILKNAKIDYTILRTILVYGQVFDQRRSNLVIWVKEMLEKKQEISIVNDQFRTPTYVADLALVCKISMDMRSKGV